MIFRYPLNHIAITQGFSSSHKGVDFGWYTQHHQPIYSVEDGTVIYKQYQTTGGNVIHIRHSDGTTTYVSEYGHLDTVLVNVGDTVTKGQQVATMGATGQVTGEHLHFGLVLGSSITYTSNDHWLNPIDYLYCYPDQEVNSYTATHYNILYYNPTPSPHSLTFNITPSSATIVLKDSNNNPISPSSGTTYPVNDGTYTYTITASGYYTIINSVAISGSDVTLNITMTPIQPIPPTPGTIKKNKFNFVLYRRNFNEKRRIY